MNVKKLFGLKKVAYAHSYGFTRLVKPLARIWTRAKAYWLGCTRNPRYPSFASAHSYGFTLAEVLITLTILGVVAAITVPNVLKNTQEREFLTRFKRVYSDLNRAFDMAYAEYGPPETWSKQMCGAYKYDGSGRDTCSPIEYVYSGVPIMMGKYLPQVQKCNSDVDNKTSDSCYLTPEDAQDLYPKVTTLNGKEDTGWGKDFVYPSVTRYYLKNGAFVAMEAADKECNSNLDSVFPNGCAKIFVDLNGKKKPNTYGKDMFTLYVTKKGIVPPEKASDCYKKGVNDNYRTGRFCSNWVIKKGNMDYLH